ncbi:hypothetical protein SAMN05444159_0996 [Bradyrhizobium lablabi]|uniref:Uncharacterized protein n=1 Tax=Bradyrhizobium lablabi TaxID=722472 RepID=A0A1M6KKC5_9BRAD|nr:hypothetical protein SAMN05444159_0996 [Bradyrhizobium lablabi]
MNGPNHQRHPPPPGLGFGEPDDRLRRGIQYPPNYRDMRAVPNLTDGEYWMPAFAGMTASHLWRE